MIDEKTQTGGATPAPDPATAGEWLGPDATVELRLTVNGRKVECRVPPRRTLADALRAAGLTGTHIGCEHGSCGTCTVLMDGRPVRACLLLAVQAAGADLRTVEGLADGGELTPVQRAFADAEALQCGFCTPGFLMLAEGLLADEPDASEERIRDVVSSNLCRCTGGAPIVRAVVAARDALKRDALKRDTLKRDTLRHGRRGGSRS
jgi:aerobic-type carbon monoxide dehydrogenase small subunit (CoxS/CutS family)